MAYGDVATPLVSAIGAQMVIPSQPASQGAHAGEAVVPKPAWQALQKGDNIALVAPSYASHKDQYGALADTMRAWGLNVVQQADMVVEPSYFGWPNTPERRADHIITALKDMNIKAIFALEGGEGASEVVEELKKREAELKDIPKRAIPLIGYSDITQLHLYLGQKGLVSPVQGPSVEFLTEREGMDAAQKTTIADNQNALRHFLMGHHDKQPDITLIPVNQAAQETAHIKGALVGGGDIPIALSNQSSHHLKTEGYSGQILFLEGRSSASLKLALSKLQARQQLGSVDAIVLGRYYDNQQYTGDVRQAYVAEVQKVLADMGVTKPVYFGVPNGHPHAQSSAAPVVPLPMHTSAEINVKDGQASLSMNRFRDVNECEYQRTLPETPIVPTATTRTEKGSIVMVDVPFNELRLPDVSAVMNMDLQGGRLVLDFGEHASIPLMHIAMTELLAAGKLKNVGSVLLTSSQPVPEEVNRWLSDFQQRHLPEIPMQAAEMQGTRMLSVLASRVAQAQDLTGGLAV